MKVPLEILRCILELACASYTRAEFWQLRLTSYLFNEEVLPLFITDNVFKSLRNYLIDVHRKRLWGAVPAGLRYAYLQHRVKKQGAKRSLFAHLFIPVYESQLNKLEISERDRAARHEKLNRWTSYCMHEYWEETWLVAYWSSAAPAKVLPYYDNYNINDRPEKRIENDRKFLEILCAIDADDSNAVLEAFAGFHSGVDDLNYCFGTTILAFAAKHGSHEMLTLLLRSVRRLTYKQLYKYLYIAITEARNPHATIDVFLNHLAQHFKDAKGNAFTCIDVARRLLTQNLLLAALARWDLLVVDAICKWMDSVPNFHGKLEMFEAIFARALPDQTLCALLPMLVTLATRNENIPGLLAMSPTHHFGASYQQRLRSKFTEVCDHRLWRSSSHPTPPRKSGGIVYAYPGCSDDAVDRFSINNKHIKSSNSLFLIVANGRLDSVERLLWAGADAEYEKDGERLLYAPWNVGRKNEVAQLMYAYGWRHRNRKWVRFTHGPGSEHRVAGHDFMRETITVVNNSPQRDAGFRHRAYRLYRASREWLVV